MTMAQEQSHLGKGSSTGGIGVRLPVLTLFLFFSSWHFLGVGFFGWPQYRSPGQIKR